MRFPRSIRLRLTLWYVLLLAIILAAFSTGIYLTLRHSLYANLDDSIEARANDLVPLVQYENGRPTLSANIAAASSDLGEQFVRVYDAAGAVTFDTSAEAGLVPDNQLALRGALSGKASTRSLKVDGESFRALDVPIERAGQVTGALEVGRAAGDVVDTLSTLLLILAIAYPITLAVASSGGIFLGGRALSPINRLTRLARRISAEDLSQRLDMRLPDDEVGRLAHTHLLWLWDASSPCSGRGPTPKGQRDLDSEHADAGHQPSFDISLGLIDNHAIPNGVGRAWRGGGAGCAALPVATTTRTMRPSAASVGLRFRAS